MISKFFAFFVAASVTVVSFSAQAQVPAATFSPKSSFRGLLGFDRGAFNLGGEYESRTSLVRAVGGYFFYQSEDKTNGISGVMAAGGFVPLHLLGNNRYDAYIAPGFGLAMIKNMAGQNETTFGPSLKIGAEYRQSVTTSFGLQFANYYNWFSSKAAQGISSTSATATFVF